jgi:hypothetical protein
MRVCLSLGLVLWLSSFALAQAKPLADGVRGVATRAPAGMKIDGDLAEFKDAFCTPVEYFHADLKNRAAQFFYMWDDEAFYAGLRTLDQKQANQAPDERLWEGDAVEWYFDARRGPDFRSGAWPTGPQGAVHCYWTGYKNAEIQPRFCLRPNFLDQIPKVGIEVAAKKTAFGAEVEFKLPWGNFPGPKKGTVPLAPDATKQSPLPKGTVPFLGLTVGEGDVIALDAELCYSDGGPRVYRSFAYGSPLSVQQPASLAKIQLVQTFDRSYWKACGPVALPIRCDTAWTQPVKNHAHGQIALPPNHRDSIGKIVFRLTDLDGQPLGEFEAKPEEFEPQGHFARATATWPTDLAPPAAHHVTAVVFDKDGKELTRVAPRLVSVNMQAGY